MCHFFAVFLHILHSSNYLMYNEIIIPRFLPDFLFYKNIYCLFHFFAQLFYFSPFYYLNLYIIRIINKKTIFIYKKKTKKLCHNKNYYI